MILEFLGALALILLTMVAYSSGITLAANRREYPVSFFDLLVVLALWIAVFWLRPNFGRLPMLAIGIGLGIVFGYLIGAVRLAGVDRSKIIPDSELPEHAREKTETAVSANIFKRGWRRWSNFAQRMGQVQGRLFMGFFYFAIVTPFGFVGRLFTDALAIKKAPANGNWHKKEQTPPTVEAAQEQG